MVETRVSSVRYGLFAATGAALAVTALLGMPDGSRFMPHGHCYLWQPRLVTLHVASDAAIALAYLTISLTLGYLVYRARSDIPFHWMILAFGTFIIACGATHAMEVWTLWRPDYWLAGDVKLLTAAVSVTTAVTLPPLVPRILSLIRAERVAEEHRLQLDERTAHLERERAARHEAELARADADQARHDAEAANRAKDQFLATVSHELRTPLSPILAWSRMLRLGTLQEPKRQRALDTIERNARAQAQLVDDLLDVSRIVAGKLRLEMRPVDAATVVSAALDSARPAAEAKPVYLDSEVDPEAGAVAGDPGRLQQIVCNLLSNAVKFTPCGGRVVLRLERAGEQVQLSVSDTGAGIVAEALPHVFERFWQAEGGTTRRHGGLGLGLAIVRHLTELHGGTVSAHSDGPGLGATFRVSLPRVVGAVDGRAGAAGADGSPFGDLSRLDGVSILVVDDDPDSNELVQMFLSSCGAEVRVAGSADQALDVLDRWRPDVLVSDIEMPGEDGYALMRRVRARPAERGGRIPAVALTAHARVEDRVNALAAGFQMHASKPVDPSELVAVVCSLDGRR